MIIQLHAVSALAAFFVGLGLLLSTKGNRRHRVAGRVFVGLMVLVAISAIFIQELSDGRFSWVHVLVPVTLVSVWRAVSAIRRFQRFGDRADLQRHRGIMISLFFGALVVAGLFTLMPGRTLHTLIFLN